MQTKQIKNFKVLVVDTARETGPVAGRALVDLIKSKPTAVVGFSTGRSPLPMYEFLIEDHLKNHTDYGGVTATNIDE